MYTKKCLVCKDGKKNDCLHWHQDEETKAIWVWCQGKCQRGYSLESYCFAAGLNVIDFLQNDFELKESRPNEVAVQSWPARFIPLSDPRAQKGVDYIKNVRGLTLEGDMYYDLERNGIVFPYYFGNHFVGSQTRYLEPKITEDQAPHKIDTMPGTRLGLLFYGWNQQRFVGNVKGVIVTEGAFNAIAINQAFNLAYGGISRSPWRACAASGSGASAHQLEAIKELKDQGMKVVIAPDLDEAGQKMMAKFIKAEACTHWALPDEPGVDWNDASKQKGREEFVKWFLTCIKKV